MRLVTTILAVLALSSLAGCATQSEATRGSETAVRAEIRRISSARPYRAQEALDASMSTSERARAAHVSSF
jgi:hypothetical protein